MKDRGWVAAQELCPGDLLTTDHADFFAAVEATTLTDRVVPVYNLSVEHDHTYFVSYDDWDFGVWAHNLSCGGHSSILGEQLKNSGLTRKAGDFAAHLVPSGNWKNPKIANTVADSQRILNRAGIGVDHAANGFFTSSRRHLGTHTHDFQRYLIRQLKAKGGRGAILDELRSISS